MQYLGTLILNTVQVQVQHQMLINYMCVAERSFEVLTS